MKGKGFSTCLICDSEDDLFLGNQLVLNVVRARYKTNNFDVMLQNTKICVQCVGRLQQLNEFCAHNAVIPLNYDDENGKEICTICQQSYSSCEIVPSTYLIGVDLTTFLKNRDDPEKEEEGEGKEVISCYSCLNFAFLYNNTKNLLTQLLDYFYNALSIWKVIVKDCGSNAEQGLANFEQEQFFGSLLLTPVENSNQSRRTRVSFAPEVEIIPEPPIKRQRLSQGNCNVTSESVVMIETASCKNIPSTKDKVAVKQNTRSLRNSIGDVPRIVSPAKLKVKKTRHSTSTINNVLSFEVLQRKHNIRECSVVLKRLELIPTGTGKNKNQNKGSAKKNTSKIKLNAKSKVTKRRMKRLMRSKKKKALDELENSVQLEVVMTQESLNNTQSSTTSADPLNASVNENTVQNHSSSFSLDDTLPVINPTDNLNVAVKIEDEQNNNKASSKENKNIPVIRSTRKTRNSTGKSTESTNVAVNNRATLKHKESLILPKKEPESNESIEMIYDDDDDSNKHTAEEPEENLEQRYRLEIELLNPLEYNNKVVKFNSTSINNEEEMELNSISQENIMALLSEDLEMNAEYLDESLEETLMSTRNSPQNDALCPIYTMDQLLNEESLLTSLT